MTDTQFKLDSFDYYTLEHYRSLNLPLLQAVRERIITEPERHDQGSWGLLKWGTPDLAHPPAIDACGTAYCVAGWAGALTRTAGWSGRQHDDGDVGWAFLPIDLDANFMDEGEWVRHGAQLLGLPQASRFSEQGNVFDPLQRGVTPLFYGTNSRDKLLRRIDYLIEAGKLAQGLTYVGRHASLVKS